jgi:uncharacterized protein (DUF427 family)
VTVVRALLDGVTLAESDATLLVEGNHYFPPESVNPEHLAPTRIKSPCFWKGLASYYDVRHEAGSARSAAWTYHHPFPWIRKIRDHVAFWAPVEIVEGSSESPLPASPGGGENR